MRGFRRTECPSSLAWEKGHMTAVSREETNEFEYLLTLVVRLPRLDDCARKLDPRGEHTTLDLHVLPIIPFRRDRLSKRFGRNGA
jgi:hypothetical protein